MIHCPKRLSELAHLDDLRKLRPIKILIHHKTVRHLIGFVIGACICLMGSTMALNAHTILETMPMHIPHPVWDALAYTIHAFGAIPILSNLEPLWKIGKIFVGAE